MTITGSMFNKFVEDRYLKVYYQSQMETTFVLINYFSDRYNLNLTDVLTKWLQYTYCKSASFTIERANGLIAAEQQGIPNEYFFASLLYGFFIYYSTKNIAINPVLSEIAVTVAEIETAGSISRVFLLEDECERLELLKVGDKVAYLADEDIKRSVEKYLKGAFKLNARIPNISFSTILIPFFTYLHSFSYIKTGEEKRKIEAVLNHYYQIFQDSIPQTIADNQALYNSYS